MKNVWNCLWLAVLIHPAVVKHPGIKESKGKLPATENLFIITTDGFRWQELFNGADSLLINSDDYTPDKETVKALYWSPTAGERRKRLMPFFWNVINARGQVYGNRGFGNKVNTANTYSVSYPGYNEMLTGNTDPAISSNSKEYNPNINVLEFLNETGEFKGQVAAFTSWDVFPYILNEQRNNLPVNSGYQNMQGEIMSPAQAMINKVQDKGIIEKEATRYDELTFLTAKEYITQHRPKVVYLGLGETDEFAHKGRYDLYLEQANKVDKIIAELWHLVQTTPGYKDHTTFLITTDHGRGSRTGKWTSHGQFIRGSSQTWFAVMGPDIRPLGEIKEEQQFYQQQMAQTIAGFLGQKFSETTAAAIDLN